MKSFFLFALLPLLIIIAVLAVPGPLWFNDPGTFFHTAVGERLLTQRTFITVDPFTCSNAGKPWIAQQWLGEVLMAVIFRFAGWDGLFLCGVVLMAGMFLILWLRLFLAGVHPLLALLILTFILSSCSHHFLLRPHLLTIVLLGMQHLLLIRVEQGHAPPHALLLLFPVYLFWTNCHGGVLGGYASLILVVCGWGVARALSSPSPISISRDAAITIVVLVLIAAGYFINPYGSSLIHTWRTIMTTPAVGTAITEHLPLLSVWYGWLVLAFGLIYLCLLAGIPLARLTATSLLPLVWLFLAWGRVRHAPLFAVVAGLSFAELIPHSRVWASLADMRPQLFGLSPRCSDRLERQVIFAVVLCLCLGLGCQAFGWPLPLVGKGSARFDPAHWPVEVTPAVQSFAESQDDGTPIFNEMLFGGWLIFHAPRLRVFIDDRCELLGESGLQDYLEGIANPDRFRVWEQRFAFRAALVISGSGFDRHLRGRPEEWRLTAEGAGGTFFVRSALLGR